MFKFYGKTLYGKNKTENDDCFLINSFVSQQEEKQQQLSRNDFLVAIADGVGSCQYGNLASLTLLKNLSKNEKIISHPMVLNIIKNTNSELLKTYKGEASTVFSIVHTIGEKVVIYHVGDTRVYKLTKNHNLIQLTNDHTYLQKLIDDGLIGDSMRHNHPKKNIILQSLGYKEDFHIDIYKNSFEPDEKLLLTTDGIHDYMTDEEIKEILLGTKNITTNINKLIETANANKSKDDISVVMISYE